MGYDMGRDRYLNFCTALISLEWVKLGSSYADADGSQQVIAHKHKYKHKRATMGIGLRPMCPHLTL